MLPEDLVIWHVASYLPPNEVACGLRATCKHIASLLSGPKYTTVKMSRPAPKWALEQRWSRDGGAMKSLTLQQRRTILRLVALSGDLANLELMEDTCGCTLTPSVLAGAAAANQLHACEWLMSRGCPCTREVVLAACSNGSLDILNLLHDDAHASATCAQVGAPDTSGQDARPCQHSSELEAAASGGHHAVCTWLLGNGCPWSDRAPAAAAHNGHSALTDSLLRQRRGRADTVLPCVASCLVSASYGCSTAVLERLYRTWVDPSTAPVMLDDRTAAAALAAAASSPTPDWATKVEWLLNDYAYASGGRRASVCALELVLACPDHAPARLQHLQHLGVKPHLSPTSSSAFTSSGPGYHPHHHPRHTSPHSPPAAPALTPASLTFLLDLELEEATLFGAAASPGGRRHCLSRALAPLAAGLGPLPVLQQLHVRGHPIPASTLHVAASAGHCEVVRWLLQVLSGARLEGSTGADTAGSGGDCTGQEDPAPASASEAAAASAAEAGAAAAGEAGTAPAAKAAAAVSWQVIGHPYQRQQLQRLLSSSLLHSALASGSVRLLAALRGLGCPWDAFTASVAVGVGSQQQLEWLVGNGCPMGVSAGNRGHALVASSFAPGTGERACPMATCGSLGGGRGKPSGASQAHRVTRGVLALRRCVATGKQDPTAPTHPLRSPALARAWCATLPYRALSNTAHAPYPQDHGLPYTMACEYGDIAMLRCLRRVGCAWGPRCAAFVHEMCPSRLPLLRALLQLGCPVQWEAALAAARGRAGRGGELLVGWLTEERARREAAEGRQQQQQAAM